MIANNQIISQKNYIKVYGGSIFSQLIYTQGTKNNVVVITVHGGPGSTCCKMRWGIYELAKEFPIIVYDQIGSGKSKNTIQQGFNRQNLWTIQNFVNQLQTLIRFYQLHKFILFGTSWGSTLSLQYYFSKITSPKPVALYLNSPLVNTKMWIEDSSILIRALPAHIYKTIIKCQSQNHTDCSQYHLAMSYFYNKHVCRSELLSQQQIILNNDASKGFNSEVYNYMWGPSEVSCTGTLRDYDRFQDIAKIDIPVVLTCGEFDEARPQTIQKFHHKIKNSRFYMYEGCSHTAHFEKPQQFRKVFLTLYKQLTRNIQNNWQQVNKRNIDII